jgi:hypothetical protein
MKYLSGIYELDGPISKYLPDFRCPVQLPDFPDMRGSEQLVEIGFRASRFGFTVGTQCH